MNNELTYSELIELLDYDPETGIFTNKVSRGPRAIVGTVAGCLNKVSGYVLVRLSGKNYMAHRLAWLWCMQEWPSNFIDHINGIRDDNRLDNLREATSAENNHNRGNNSNSKTGYKGVSFHKASNKYEAQILINSKKTYLGLYTTAQEASQAYETAATEYFKEFKRENTI